MDNCPNCGGMHFGQNECPFMNGSLKAKHDVSTADITRFNHVKLISRGHDIRDNVIAFENLMKEQPQVTIETKHYFSKGVYAREIFIPKGVILTGHIHKYTNLNIISKGKIKVLVGEELQIIEAPATLVSPPGTKRIAIALEDTIWTTIHGTDETDIDIIEQTFIAHTEEEYLEFHRQLSLPFNSNGSYLD